MHEPTDTRALRPLLSLTLAFALAFALALAVTFVPGWWGGVGAAWAVENEAREVGEPELEAGAWALADLRSGELLAWEDAKARLPMASTTKIMAALVTLKGGNLDEEATVSRRAAAFATPAYSNVGLVAGDTLSVREL